MTTIIDPANEASCTVLSLLREWGWEAGIERIRAQVAAEPDASRRGDLELFAGWLAGERGANDEAIARFKALEERAPELKGWSLIGQAFLAMREKTSMPLAHKLIDAAERACGPQDAILRGTVHHCRAATHFHSGSNAPALAELQVALGHYGKEHFGSGRVLDTLGMLYASRDNFHAAKEFYEQALSLKARFRDETGLAVTHGNLGRLYLDWGNLERAREHFLKDLDIARRVSPRGEAQMYNFLGAVAIAEKAWKDARAWLKESIERAAEGGWRVMEGYAHKDCAVACVAGGPGSANHDLDAARTHVEAAEKLLEFAEGRAHLNRALALIRRAEGKHGEAERLLRSALVHFDTAGERAEAARVRFEEARTLRARGAPVPLVRLAFVDALERAERCRRAALVREIEAEFAAVDETELRRHLFRRVRGRGIQEDAVSLLEGVSETATILFLDIKGYTELARSEDPSVVMMTLNQIFADLEDALEQHGATVNQYLGDGFMAFFRGPDHADRAVDASLGMVEGLSQFNRPREILGLKPLEIRIGINTGDVKFGNVGTYKKMDFTAVGVNTNIAARLQACGRPGQPCISRSTWERVRDKFTFAMDNPRKERLKGLGEVDHEIYDVVGRRKRG